MMNNLTGKTCIGFLLMLTMNTVLADSYQNQTAIRQVKIDQRIDQIQHEMKTQSDSMLNSQHQSSQRTFTPTFGPILQGYTGTRSITAGVGSMSSEQIEDYLKKLGDPDTNTGIFAYSPEERLFRYGVLCIEVGLTAEGVRAISAYLHRQADVENR